MNWKLFWGTKFIIYIWIWIPYFAYKSLSYSNVFRWNELYELQLNSVVKQQSVVHTQHETHSQNRPKSIDQKSKNSFDNDES